MKTTYNITSFIVAFTFMCISCTNAQTHIAADNTNIQYIGRVDFSDPLQPSYTYPGVSINAKFNGTDISAVIHDYSSGTTSSTNYYKIIIDDVITTEQLAMINGENTYVLASGLTAGDHTIQLMKITEGAAGKSSFKGFTVTGGTASLVTPDARPNKKIEFIGDSWTCGYGNLTSFATGSASMASGGGFIAENEDNYYSWAPITARAIGADYHVTAISGRGLYRNNTGSETFTVPINYEFIHEDKTTSYDHSTFHPDIISIHLGTNDMAQEGTEKEVDAIKMDDVKFEKTYLDFITKLLTEHPCAQIIMCMGNSKSNSWPTWTTQLRRLETIATNIMAIHNKGNVHQLTLPYTAEKWGAGVDCGYGDAWHPTKCSHEEMSVKLIEKINALTIDWGTTTSCPELADTSLWVDPTVGIDDISKESINIYPNPAQNTIVVQGLNKGEWKIVNNLGEVVLRGTESSINIESFSNGVYALLSTSANQFVSAKFIKN
ncbi:MAG: lysophospholipase L1-like esterase [Saprospiraceae bacterium]|jgi:lysophospholipase L1-like esterase